MPGPRLRPEKLGAKLLAVRLKFEYSQADMAAALSDDDASIVRQDIHRYEIGKTDPPLVILLRYSKLARVKMEIFADDSKDLPW